MMINNIYFYIAAMKCIKRFNTELSIDFGKILAISMRGKKKRNKNKHSVNAIILYK